MKTRPLLAILSLLWMGSACAASPVVRPVSTPPLPALAARPARTSPVAPDEAIQETLVRELARHPATAGERIGVTSRNGIVTLYGQTSIRAAKDRAAAVARVVEGVRAIVDRVALVSRHVDDAKLTFVVAAALGRDPAVATQPIAASAHGGCVHLTGDVDSEAARRIAENDLLRVDGVLQVASSLPVRALPRPDAVIEKQIERLLQDDPWLDARAMAVHVSEGRAHLEGAVPSAVERARAESDARAASPPALDLSELRIAPSSGDGTLRASPPAHLADEELTQALLDAYDQDPRVRPLSLAIDVQGGVLVLTGTAPYEESRWAAVDDARHVPGVSEVHADLTADPALGQTDGALRSTVHGVLSRDPRLSDRRVGIEVVEGRVLLRGSVASDTDRWHALIAAASAPGTRGVEEDLRVFPPRLRPNDAELARAVRARFVRDGSLPASVRVSASRGTISVDGSVDSWGQWQAATELAYDAGAESVVNNILVKR